MSNFFMSMSSKEFRERFVDKQYKPRKTTVSKYHNKKTERNGKTYDSKKEASHGEELEILQKAGKIYGLEEQKAFPLIDPFTYKGRKIRGTTWVADFYYFDCGLRCWVAEDVKSAITRKKPEYRIKMKLFMQRYPKILFKEVV